MSWRLLIFALDSIIFVIAALAAWLLRNGVADGLASLAKVYPYLFVSAIAGPLLFVLMRLQQRSFRFFSLREFNHVVATVSMAILVTVLITFVHFRLEDVPRSLPLLHWLLAIIGISALRLAGRLLSTHLHHRDGLQTGERREPVLIIGLNPLTDICLRTLEAASRGRIHAAGILDSRAASRGMMVRHCQVIGAPDELAGILARLSIHGLHVRRIVLTIPRENLEPRARHVLETLEKAEMISVVDFPSLLTPLTRPLPSASGAIVERPLEGDLAVPVMTRRKVEEVMRRYGWKKRLMDIAGASILGILAFPVLAVCIPLVMLSIGTPVFFWQERPGRNGRPIRIYKLRTMKDGVDAEGNLIPDEQRQTAIGNFLRRFRLDELPQLYNILKGDMSFIGPRPLLPIDLPEDMPQWNTMRAQARPGLTGWAQVNGGKQVSKRDKVVLDVWYLANMSLRLDLYILLKTIEMTLRGERLDEESIRRAYHDLGIASENMPHMQEKNA